MALQFIALNSNTTAEMLSLIPLFFNPEDEAPAAAQLDRMYQHGGGWRPMEGFNLDPMNLTLQYGDPNDQYAESAYTPLAFAVLNEEVILIYENAWVLILQKDGSFEVSRVD